MATIGEEVEIDRTNIATNVTDDTPYFYPTTKVPSFPADVEYRYDNSIYRNVSDTIQVYDWSSTEETAGYELGQVVYKDGAMTTYDGTEAYLGPAQPDNTSAYPLTSTGFDHTTWTTRYSKLQDYPTSFVDGGGTKTLPDAQWGTEMSPDGTKLYALGYNASQQATVTEYALNVTGDVSSAVKTTNVITISTLYFIADIAFNPTGTVLIIASGNYAYNYDLYEYNLTSGFNLGTATTSTPLRTHRVDDRGNHSYDDRIQSISFSSTGATIYIYFNYSADEWDMGFLYFYNLGGTWSFSSNELFAESVLGGSTLNKVSKVAFSSGGTKMFVLSSTWDMVYAYDLATANDPFSKGDYTEVKEVTAAYGLTMASDGLSFIVSSSTTTYTYHLTSAHVITYGIQSKLEYIVHLISSTIAKRYYVKSNGTDYTFRSDIKDLTASTTLYSETITGNVYTTLDTNSIEHKSILIGDVTNSSVVLGTLIWTDDGLYTRTQLEVDMETVELTGHQYAEVIKPSDMEGFALIRDANEYRPFDGANTTPAVTTLPTMEYTIYGIDNFNAITLSKVLAETLTYTFTLPVDETAGSDYLSWLDGNEVTDDSGNGIVKTDTITIDCNRDPDGTLSRYPTTLMYYSDYNMPEGSSVNIVLGDTNYGTISLGDFTLNNTVNISFTELNFSHGMQDWNDYTPDAWGAIPEATKAITTKFNLTCDLYLENYDYAISFLESIKGRFVSIDGSDVHGAETDSQGKFASLTRRVIITGATPSTFIADGQLARMANVKLSVQEIV